MKTPEEIEKLVEENLSGLRDLAESDEAKVHVIDFYLRVIKAMLVNIQSEAMQEYADQDRWISVEQPPESKCQVLAINNGEVVVANYEIKYWLQYIQGTPLLFQPILDNVTHWQPLPKPPQI